VIHLLGQQPRYPRVRTIDVDARRPQPHPCRIDVEHDRYAILIHPHGMRRRLGQPIQ
jgi:hypothetical protein